MDLRATLIASAAVMFALGVEFAVPAKADPGQDRDFYRLLTDPNQDQPMVIWDFATVRAQGIEVCEREDAGETPMRATLDLDRRYGGPYICDDANNISSSAETIFCPWHQGNPSGSLINRSTPVYPRPLYPPLAWLPASAPQPPSPEPAESPRATLVPNEVTG